MSDPALYNGYLLRNRNIVNILLLLLVFFVITLPYTNFIVLLLFLSMLAMMLIDPVIQWLEGVGIGRMTSIILLTGLAIISSITGFIRIFGRIEYESATVADLIDSTYFTTKIKTLLPFLQQNEIVDHYCSFLQFIKHRTIDIFSNQAPTFIAIIIIPILTFFLLKDGFLLKKTFIQSLPNHYIEMFISFLYRLKQKLNVWIRAQVLIALLIGGLISLAFYSLNVDSFLLTGTMVGLSFLIPYYGTVIGAMIALTIALLQTDSASIAIAIIIAFATIKLLYNLLFVKFETNHPHPFIVLLILLIGIYTGGFVGMLTIMPIANFTILTGEEIYHSLKRYGFI